MRWLPVLFIAFVIAGAFAAFHIIKSNSSAERTPPTTRSSEADYCEASESNDNEMLVTTAPESEHEEEPEFTFPPFEFVNARVMDEGALGATAISEIVLLGDADEEQMKMLLLYAFLEASDKGLFDEKHWGGGYEYYGRPTHVYIQLFLSEAHRACGLWIAQCTFIDNAYMIGGTAEDAPTVEFTVKTDVLEKRKEISVQQFGLSESQRRRIFSEYHEVINAAILMAADEIIGPRPGDPGYTAMRGRLAAEEVAAIGAQKLPRLEAKLCEWHGITMDVLKSIVEEGDTKLWPYPPLRRGE